MVVAGMIYAMMAGAQLLRQVLHLSRIPNALGALVNNLPVPRSSSSSSCRLFTWCSAALSTASRSF
jgi:hypothetical protein